MGLSQIGRPLVRCEGLARRTRDEVFAGTHHPCLRLGGSQPYSAPGGKLSMSWQAADLLKQQISLLDYLQGQGWKPARRSTRGQLLGLCPLHADHQPSLLFHDNISSNRGMFSMAELLESVNNRNSPEWAQTARPVVAM